MIKFTTPLFCLATLALGTAYAEPHDVTILGNVSVGKTQLKAGEYKIEMQGDKAVFTTGKKTIGIPATLQKNDQAFASTVLVSRHSQLEEIDLAGTQDRIVFIATTSK